MENKPIWSFSHFNSPSSSILSRPSWAGLRLTLGHFSQIVTLLFWSLSRLHPRIPFLIIARLLIPKLQLSGLLAPSILNPPHMLVIILQKLHLTISVPPILMEIPHLILLNVIIMVGLLHLIAPLLLNNFMSLVIEHPLLSYSVHSIAILVCLLFLRDGLTILVLTCWVLVVAVFLDFSVRPDSRAADEGLAYIGALLAVAVGVLVHWSR